jgi:hypothetical protein
MTVKVGAASQDFSFNTSGHSQTSMGWAPESLTFVATGTSTPLSFQSDDNTGFGPALDEVSVEPVGGSTGFVPEPTGIVAMLGLAVMGLLGLVWHRRTAA